MGVCSTGGVMYGRMVDWWCDVWWTGGVIYGRMVDWWCDVWAAWFANDL